MGVKFHYDIYTTLYENVQRFSEDQDMWDDTDRMLYNSLKIQQRNVGPGRKKWNYFLDHMKIKVIVAMNKTF